MFIGDLKRREENVDVSTWLDAGVAAVWEVEQYFTSGNYFLLLLFPDNSVIPGFLW